MLLRRPYDRGGEMRIGYCSQFSFSCSEVSNCDEELIFELAKKIKVILFSPTLVSNQKIVDSFEVHQLTDLDNEELRNSLDHIVYCIGNNEAYNNKIFELLEKYPGIIDLHKAENSCEVDLYELQTYVEKATGIVVHSEAAKQLVLGLRNDIPIVKIMHHFPTVTNLTNEAPRDSRLVLALPSDATIIVAFGTLISYEHMIKILDALEQLKQQGKSFLYVFMGEIPSDFVIDKEIELRQLSDYILITGNILQEQIELYLQSADIGFVLSSRVNRENLHYMLKMGKKIIVPDTWDFIDYPIDVVSKICWDDNGSSIREALNFLTKKKRDKRHKNSNARQFAFENCSLEKNSNVYINFLAYIRDHVWCPDYEDMLISRLCEIGLTEENYAKHIFQFVQDFS